MPRPMTSLRLSVVALLLIACSGGTGTLPTEESTSSGGSSGQGQPSGQSGSSSSDPGQKDPNTTTPATPPKGEPIDLANATQITIALGYCGGAQGQCYGQKSYTIDLATSALLKTGCGFGAADGRGSTLSADALAKFKSDLAAVRVGPNTSTNSDGNMFVLQVRTTGGETLYSPASSCNHSAFQGIVSGFEPLWKLVEAEGKRAS